MDVELPLATDTSVTDTVFVMVSVNTYYSNCPKTVLY